MVQENLIEFIQDKTGEIEAARKDLLKKLQPRFKQLFEPFLEKYPQVKRLGWTQYSPYFNDGDTCEFSVRSLCADTSEEGEGEIYDGIDLDYPKYESEKLKKEFGEGYEDFIKDASKLVEVFRGIDDSIMKDLFGDHALIIVNREGLEVEEYSHD